MIDATNRFRDLVDFLCEVPMTVSQRSKVSEMLNELGPNDPPPYWSDRVRSIEHTCKQARSDYNAVKAERDQARRLANQLEFMRAASHVEESRRRSTVVLADWKIMEAKFK